MLNETTTIEATEATEVKVERRGRPIEMNSARQMKIQKIVAKIMNGEVIKRGRPINSDSVRQQRLDAIKEKQANGIEIKRGRPKGTTGIPRNVVSKVNVDEILADIFD